MTEETNSVDFGRGFSAGVDECVRVLRMAALEHESKSTNTSSIAERCGHQAASQLLSSYANGLEMTSWAVKQEPK